MLSLFLAGAVHLLPVLRHGLDSDPATALVVILDVAEGFWVTDVINPTLVGMFVIASI